MTFPEHKIKKNEKNEQNDSFWHPYTCPETKYEQNEHFARIFNNNSDDDSKTEWIQFFSFCSCRQKIK